MISCIGGVSSDGVSDVSMGAPATGWARYTSEDMGASILVGFCCGDCSDVIQHGPKVIQKGRRGERWVLLFIFLRRSLP